MKARYLLPGLYIVVAVFLVMGPPGEGGHGPGGELFFYLSLPAGFISIWVQGAFKSGALAVLSCFVAGILQYVLIGYAVDRVLRGIRIKKEK